MQRISHSAMALLLFATVTYAQEKPGQAITSGVGLAETTAQIMARQATTNVVSVPRIAPRLRPTLQRQFNPDTLPGEMAEPMGKATRASLKIAQTSGPNWLGAELFDAKAFPPDSMGAVGPSQYIVAINGRIRTFDRKGEPDPTLDVDTDVFFASAMTPLGGSVTSNFTSDPRIRYDRATQRWYIVMIDVPNGGGNFFANRVMIAVSDTPQISSTTVWRFFFFNPSANFVDYPTLGIDNNALYIGANIFNLPGTAYINADGYVVRKSSIQGAGPATVTLFSNLIPDTSCASGDGPYTPQGVDNANSAAEGYFIGISFCLFGKLVVRRVSNPGTASPTISASLGINTPAFTVAYTQPHLGNTGGDNGFLDASDARLMSAQVRNGSLYTAHGIAVKPDGTAVGYPTFDATGRNALRWYRINNLTTTPAIADSGTVYDSTATDPYSTNVRWYSYPGIQVNGQGHVAIGFTASGPQQRANAGFTGRLASDAPGVTDTPTLYTNALQAYNPPNDPGGQFGRRWGDYSYTSVDPNDDMTMFTIQEYTNAQDSWGVRVMRLIAPGPATPTAISTASVPTGTASTTVTLTGTSTNGSGFFDPGSGFPNRIAVEILPGVTVTGVTVVDPTHLSVTFSTVGASVGEKVIRVINPDGQTVSQASTLLTVTGTQAPFFISPNSVICTVGSACNFTFVTQNGAPASTFSIAGTLPAGVTFATPSLSGTPASGTQGTYTLTVTANNGTAPNATQTFTLIVTAPCGGFTDVTTGDIFCNSSDWLKNRGVTLGCTATQYCPTQFVTRAQMALFMQRLGDAISPAIYSDNVIGTGALNVDNRPSFCTTPAFPAMNYPRVALVSWMFDGYADGALDVRVYSRTSFDNLGSYATNEVSLPRLRVNDRAWSTVSANVKVNIPAGSSPRFGLRMDRIQGLFSGNFTDGRCNISVIMTSVNGGALPYDVPTQPQEPTDP
ncbi:MAG: Ig domain-containing protein [Burkholderiales bacterium]